MSIIDVVIESFGVKNLNKTLAYTIAYSYKAISIQDYNTAIKKYCPNTSTLNVRRFITNDAEYLSAYKFAIMDAIRSSYSGRYVKVPEIASKYSIDREELLSCVHSLMVSTKPFNLIVKLLEKYPEYTKTDVHRIIGTNSQLLITYCTKFAIRKFRFLCNFEGYSVEDYSSMLLSYGIAALYKSFPKIETDLHGLNIIKQHIHNEGINYIISATKSDIMIKESDSTFSSIKVSLDLLTSKGGYGIDISDDREQELLENKLIIYQLLKKYEHLPSYHGAISTLFQMNVEDDFVEYLESLNLIKTNFNDYYDSIVSTPIKLFKLCAKYYCIPMKSAKLLYTSLAS